MAAASMQYDSVRKVPQSQTRFPQPAMIYTPSKLSVRVLQPHERGGRDRGPVPRLRRPG